MKLLLENWNKFLQEQEMNEATEQEIEYLNDALEVPIEEMPFGNIFGNSYRIIEPVSGLKQQTPLANAIFALNKFGWQVDPASNLEYHDETKGKLAGKVKGGKILCSKTKVSHYIDGKGNQGVSRKSVVLNLPKVLGGIISFVNNSRDKIQRESSIEHFEAAKRYAKLAKIGKLDKLPADAKYKLPADFSDPNIKHTANEYRKIMKFYDASNFWIGRDYSGTGAALQRKFKALGIDFENFENFAKYAMESFDDLIRNMDQYIEKNYIIYSRHPIDVFRMSDHEGIQSCHSLPSEKGEVGFDQYNKCALSEAYGNGMIAYIVPAKNFKMFPPTQESLDKVGDQEIFYDKTRPDAGELVPTSRIRIKHVAYHRERDDDEPIRVAVPQGKVYGPKVPGFIDAVQNKMATTQKQQINDIIKAAGKFYGEGHVQMNGFTRYGGSYQDVDYHVAQTIPALFRKVSKNVEFHGHSVRYEPDVEEALLASIGQNEAELTRQRLNEIFDEHTGGFIKFNWEVDEDYDGRVFFNWKMIVTFRINIPSSANGSEIDSAVGDAVDGMVTDYYDLPETDNYFVTRWDEKSWQIQLVYAGSDLGERLGVEVMYLYGLEENLQTIVDKMNVFDYYHEDGAIQLIEYNLEEYGVVEAERYKIRNVMQKYDLEDDSWWTVAEEENAEHDYFGGEYLNFIAYEDFTSLDLTEMKDKIPENMKEAGYKHIADFLNLLMKSDELASKLALNQDTWDKEKDPNIVIMYDGTTQDLDPEELDQADVIDIRAGVSMYNDYSKEILDKTGNYLQNNASIDDLNERIMAALEKYLVDKLKGQQGITENKRRVKVRVRR